MQKPETLPFVTGLNFWNVQPTGDYRKDFETGSRYILALTKFISSGQCTKDLISSITAAMPCQKNFSGIEAGFWALYAKVILQVMKPNSPEYDAAFKIYAGIKQPA